MSNIKLEISNYLTQENVTIQEMIEMITASHKGAIIVVDNRMILQGVISDGDIRRALLKQATLLTPASKIVNMNVISLLSGEDIESRAREIFSKNTVVNLIPVINKNNKVIDIITR